MNCSWCGKELSEELAEIMKDSTAYPKPMCPVCQNQWWAMDDIMARASGLVSADYQAGIIWLFFNCGKHAIIVLARIYFDLSGHPGQWGAYIGVSHNTKNETEAALEVHENKNLAKLYHREAIGLFPCLERLAY